MKNKIAGAGAALWNGSLALWTVGKCISREGQEFGGGALLGSVPSFLSLDTPLSFHRHRL